MGAALFAVSGATLMVNGAGNVSGGLLNPGTFLAALGNGAFLQGSGSLGFSQALGETYAISGAIADQTGSWPVLGISAASIYPTGGPYGGLVAGDWSYSSAGSWALSKSGAGTLLLSGANTFSGSASSINAGNLIAGSASALGFGSWTNNATLQLTGTAGVARIVTLGSSASGMPNANYTQAASGTLALRVSGAGCPLPDRVNVKNVATLAGTVSIAFSDGCVPVIGNSFTVLSATGISGSFASITSTGLPGGLHLSASYPANSVLITVGALLQCAAGSYSIDGFAPCTPASPGNFVPTAGATAQTACVAGSYQPNAGRPVALQRWPDISWPPARRLRKHPAWRAAIRRPPEPLRVHRRPSASTCRPPRQARKRRVPWAPPR